MNKCLVTKLKGSVSNNNLLKIGEMRMRIAKVENPTDATQSFGININKPVTFKIVGDGYFTDKTLVENKGKTITLDGNNGVWVSNDDVEIAILDKYSINSINVNYPGQTSTSYGSNLYLDLSYLKYSTALTYLDMHSTQVTGDIANLKNLTALTYMDVQNTQVTGDIANLKNLTALTYINIYNKQVPLIGNIGNLSTLTKCEIIQLKYSKLTGDLATLPSVCKFVSFGSDKGSVFTWSTRPSSAKIIAIEGKVSLTNIDKMLQDQAQCQVGFSTSDGIWLKTISVTGTRTSASDAAVQTLQQKGYTVTINPA